MDNYTWLIKEIRESNIDNDVAIERWATAVETMVKERKEMTKDLRRAMCDTCKNRKNGFPCCKCTNGCYWEWRGA